MKLTHFLPLLLLPMVFSCKPMQEPKEKSLEKASFYQRPPIFQFRPDENRAGQAIERFGPVGIGIDLHKPAWVMKIKNIEEGSPADLTGKLKAGMTIESINGEILKDIDPRIQLGNIITQAEASDGKISLQIREGGSGNAQLVEVKIPVLGSYSKTWPLNCSKSDAIVKNLANFLRQKEKVDLSYLEAPSVLFMLSTGNEADLKVVRKWVKQLVDQYAGAKTLKANNWTIGRMGTSLCEYYLRTGDKSIFPLLKLMANHATWDMYNNGWAHGMYRGKEHMVPDVGMAFGYMGGGHMNACGVHMPTFLLLAKECGVDVNEDTLQKSLKYFYRFASHGAVPYGDQLPEPTYVDNGRDGGLAFAMAAAASLTPNGENSVYAKARDHAAVKGFYSTSWMLIGHTGGGVGELWRSASMGLMHEKKPSKYREFMDNRQWWLELSRRWDGSFGILGGTQRYDQPMYWAVRMGMSYTVPRKTLRLTGAPKTKFSTSHQLPERPWGRAADTAFHSIEPAVQPDGKKWNVDAETLIQHASRPVGAITGNPAVSDEILLRYAHHPEHGMRQGAAGRINKHQRDHLVPLLLKSKDPRVRHVGAMTIYGIFKRTPMETERVTPEMVDLLMKMINNPEESLWGIENALRAMGQASKDLIVPHVNSLVPWLEHEEWWMTAAAMRPLSKVVSDPKFYRMIIDPVGKFAATTTRVGLSSSVRLLSQGLVDADPSIQNYAVKVLGKAYAAFPTALDIHSSDRITMEPAVDVMLRTIGQNMVPLSGGLDELFKVAKARSPQTAFPQKNLFLSGDPKKFSPQIKEAFLKILIPEFVATHRSELDSEAQAKPKGGMFALGKMDELAGLYGKAGISGYNWNDFGPDRLKMPWHYFSFDPPETKRWLPGTRYRNVTPPSEMKKWSAVDFKPEEAGWKTGHAPFGQTDGKAIKEGGCSNSVCRCSDPVATLWEKEVLLVRGTFSFPKMKKGHRYRLLIGGGSHVNGGDGYEIYVNGKLLQKMGRGPRKREGGKPRGVLIPSAIIKEFNQGPVTIAAKSFLSMNPRTQALGNYLTLWVQEMKLPPLD